MASTWLPERTIGGRPLRAPAEVVFVHGDFHP
jgi:hypothetical protein